MLHTKNNLETLFSYAARALKTITNKTKTRHQRTLHFSEQVKSLIIDIELLTQTSLETPNLETHSGVCLPTKKLTEQEETTHQKNTNPS